MGAKIRILWWFIAIRKSLKTTPDKIVKTLIFETDKGPVAGLAVLSEGLQEMQQRNAISRYRHGLFSDLLGLRNKAIHYPANLSETDFLSAIKKLSLLEEGAP